MNCRPPYHNNYCWCKEMSLHEGKKRGGGERKGEAYDYAQKGTFLFLAHQMPGAGQSRWQPSKTDLDRMIE